MRAIRYHRLSNFTEASTSIDRQEAETAERVAREGWSEVASFSDPNVSGAKARANAEKALAMLSNDEADVLVVSAFDRWSRMGLGAVADLVKVLDERERSGSPALFVTIRDGISSAAAGWRITAVVIAEVARQERENTSARTTASIARLTEERRFRGGTPPYGYRVAKNTDRPGYSLELDAEAAAVVREAARQILAGASVYAVVSDLNRRRVSSRLGGEWAVTRMTRMLTSPRIVGQVIYRDEVVRDGEGMPVTFWPPVLDVETWERLRVALGVDKVSDETPRPRGRRAARLLSGLLFCSGCGGVLYVNRVRATPTYQCDKGHRGSARCPRPVSIRAEAAEEHLTNDYLTAFGESTAFERVEVAPEDVGLSSVLRAIEATTAELAKAATPEVFQRLLELQGRRDALQAAPRTRRVELRPTGLTVSETWEAAEGTAARRALLAAAYGRVTVKPASKGGRYSPVDDRFTTIANPVFAAGVSAADRYVAGAPAFVVDADELGADDFAEMDDDLSEA